VALFASFLSGIFSPGCFLGLVAIGFGLAAVRQMTRVGKKGFRRPAALYIACGIALVSVFVFRWEGIFREAMKVAQISPAAPGPEVEPTTPKAYLERAARLADQKQYDRAMADLGRAMTLDPGFAPAYHNRAIVALNRGKVNDALQDLNQAITLKPDYALAYCNRGNVYRSLRQWDKALADYSRAIEIYPDYNDAYEGRGQIYALVGEFDKAIADESRVIRFRPFAARPYGIRGHAYLQKGDTARGQEDLGRAKALGLSL
jgi:tetratricopeptide (TPR) repeat protein